MSDNESPEPGPPPDVTPAPEKEAQQHQQALVQRTATPGNAPAGQGLPSVFNLPGAVLISQEYSAPLPDPARSNEGRLKRQQRARLAHFLSGNGGGLR